MRMKNRNNIELFTFSMLVCREDVFGIDTKDGRRIVSISHGQNLDDYFVFPDKKCTCLIRQCMIGDAPELRNLTCSQPNSVHHLNFEILLVIICYSIEQPY